MCAISLSLCLTAAVLTGCAAAKRLYTATPQPPATNAVPILGLTTNPATGQIAVDVVDYSNLVSNPTNYAPSAHTQAVLGTVSTVSTLLPPPWDAVGLGVTGLASTLLGLWGRKLSKQTTTQQAVIGSIITGVEAATTIGSTLTPGNVKAAIQKAAIDNGVAGQLHAAVKTITEGAPPQT